MDQTRILDLPLSWPATWLSSQPIVRGPVAVRGLRDASKLPPGWVANNAVIKRDGWFPTKPTEYRQEACYYPSNANDLAGCIFPRRLDNCPGIVLRNYQPYNGGDI